MIRARKHIKNRGVKVYEIWGPLFFGSVQAFNSKFDAKNDPDNVKTDFTESRVSDHSGIEALEGVVNKSLVLNKTVTVTHLIPDCKPLLVKANPKFEQVIDTPIDDPRYYVVTNLMDQ